MNSLITRKLLFFIFIMMILVPSCGGEGEAPGSGGTRQEKNSESSMLPASDQGAPVPKSGQPLEVLRYFPEGQIDHLNQIVFMFNQPMAALGDYANVPQDAIEVEPPIKGNVRWLNQYSLAFIPDAPIHGSYKGRVSLKPGLKALSGDVLPQGVNFEVSLPDLAVISKSENDNYANRSEALKPVYMIFFSQPVEQASMQAVFSFSHGAKEQFIDAEITPVEHSYYQKGSAYYFRAKSELPPDTPYTIILRPGAKAVGGYVPAGEILLANGRTFGALNAHIDSHYENECPPEHGLYVYFSNPVVMSDALRFIKINNGYDLSQVLKNVSTQQESDAIENESGEEIINSSSVLYLPGGFLPETNYVITLEPGLKDIYGQILEKKVEIKFLTDQYKPFVKLDKNYGLMEKDSPPKVALTVSNMKEVEVYGYALTPKTAVEFLKSINASSDYYWVDKQHYEILKNVKRHKIVLPVPDEAKNGALVLPLDLKELFGDDMLEHVLFIESSWLSPSDDGKSLKRSTNMLLQFSDLGLAIKKGRSSSLVWVTDMGKGEGFPGAEVELWNSDGEILWQGQSDENGLCQLPGSDDFPKHEDNKTRYYVVARAESNMSLWGMAWDSGLERWRFNIPYENSYDAGDGVSALNAWLLSALPIYKPGETAKLKLIVRQQQGDELKSFSNQTLNMQVYDARGTLIETSTVKTNDMGSIYHELPIPSDAALGSWNVNLSLHGKEYQYVGQFKVYNYRAPAFAIKFDQFPDNKIAGDKVTVLAEADYHFGSPVKSQPVNYSVTSYADRYFSFPQLPDYSVINDFSANDDYDDSINGYNEPVNTVLSDASKLSADGKIKFDIDLSLPSGSTPTPRQYMVNMTVEDVDQRTVSSSASFISHPAEIYAGLMTPSYLGKAGELLKVKAVAVDLDGNLVPQVEIDVKLYRREWKTVRRKSVGEVYEYVSKSIDTEISSQKITSDKVPSDVFVTPDKPGNYFVVASLKDKKGRLNEASTSFFASGDGYAGWRRSNDEILTLVPDKKEYKAGDVAKIMVQSPFSQGYGLVTVERSGIKRSSVFKIESQTPIVELPLKEDDAPNVFVSVMLVQGRIADKPIKGKLDLGKPSVRLGYVELSLPSKKDLLDVDVKIDRPEVGPGEEIEVKVAVRDQQGKAFNKAEVALLLADAAVLQLGGDSAYFPASLFHQKYLLQVQTANNLVNLIGRRNWGLKGANPGGGGGMMSEQTSIDIRRNFAALAYFDPFVKLDENGEAVVKIKMPENLSTFKVFAIATGDGRFTGTGQSSVLVSRDLLVRLALPNYAGVGDDFNAAVIVSNRGKNSGEAKVTIDGVGFSMLEKEKSKTVSVKAGGSEEVAFRVKAGEDKQAKFVFTVTMGGDSDAAEFVIPVSPPNRLRTQASYERIVTGDYKVDLKISPDADPSRSEIELELAPSLVGVMDEPFKWMTNYPHGCVEQSTSQAYANLVWLGLKSRLKTSPEQEAQARQHIENQIKKLQAWHMDGGYNYWPSEQNWSTRSVYLSAYVLDFLVSAKEAGFKVREDNFLKPIKAFLKSSINGEVQWPLWYSEQAIAEAQSYVIAMLSRAGENVAPHIEMLYSKRDKASVFELINLLRALHYQPKGAPGRAEQIVEVLRLLMNNISMSAGKTSIGDSWNDYFLEIWSSPTRSTSMALLALCESAPSNDLIPGLVRWLVDNSKEGHFGSTQNNVYALQALGLYVKLQEPQNPDLNIEALVGNSKLADVKFTSFKDKPVRNSLPFSAVDPNSTELIYKSQGEGQAWASLKLKTAPKEADLSADGSGGFILSRSFAVIGPENRGEGLNTFKKGELVKVTVTMMVPATRHNMLMVDRVPAGFEPVNFQLKDADMTLMAHFARDEDDDAYGYTSSYWYDHQEIWPDKVAVYATYLEPGVYTFSYLARAVTPGSYLTPGPEAEEMYAPETFGRGAGHQLTVSGQ